MFTQSDVRDYGAVENAVLEVDTFCIKPAIIGVVSTHDKEAEKRAINLKGTVNLLKAAQKFDFERFILPLV